MQNTTERSSLNNLQYELITSRVELNGIQHEWNELLQRSTNNNIFLTWEWVSSWMEFLGDDQKPWVLIARNDKNGKLLGLAPLMQHQHISQKGFKYRILTFIGSYKAAPDHLDFIVDADYEQIIVPALLRGLTQQDSPYILNLSGLASESTLARRIQNQAGYRFISKEVCPYIELPEDWQSFKNTLSKNLRKDLEYNNRRLEKLYPEKVLFSQVSDEKEVESALGSLFRLHMDVRKAHGDTGAFGDERMRKFHRRVASNFLKNDWLRLYCLRVGEKVIALIYCFQYNNVLSFYTSGYDLSWRKYSPGNQIIAYSIRRAIEEKASKYDFLRGDESYKYRWADKERININIEFSTSKLRKVHLIYLEAKNLTQSAKQVFRNFGSSKDGS